MQKLDRAGVDYLIEVAKQVGFELNSIETRMDAKKPPRVVLSLTQVRIVDESDSEFKTIPIAPTGPQTLTNDLMTPGTITATRIGDGAGISATDLQIQKPSKFSTLDD